MNDAYEELYQDLVHNVGHLLDDILDLLGVTTERETCAYLGERLESRARLWAANLLGDDENLAAQTVIDLMGVVNPSDHPLPEDWWKTPLGRATARSVGHPSAEAVSYSVAGAMLGVSKSAIQDLLQRGKLDRHPDGGVTTESIRRRLVGAYRRG